MSEVIPHWLTKQATISPSQTAIETGCEEAPITFSELQSASTSYAKKLAHIGVEKGDHIGILSTNSSQMVIAIHALSYVGAVAVLLNTRLTKKEWAYQIEHSEMKLLLLSEDMENHFNDHTFNVQVKSLTQINDLPEKHVCLQSEINLNDHFTIMYTSGTTGHPKAVVHTYGNHWWSAIGSALNLGIHANDKWLATLPIFHVGGFSIFIKSVIYGMPVYLLKTFNEKKVHHAIMNDGVTIISVVTVMVQRLLEVLQEGTYPNGFRCMLLGGGPAPLSLLERAVKKQIPIYQSYGLTETSSQIATIHPSDALKKIGSAGKPLMSAQLQIKDPNVDGIGEIIVKGPMVTKMYFKDKESTSITIKNEWLSTGDLGYVDEDGFLYVVDRRTDLIISGGENIYPTEIESIISSLNGVREVGVVGKQDDVWGKVPVAVVVLEDDLLTATDIIDHVKQHLANYKVPKEIYFVDHLPRNASNKILRRELLTGISTYK